MRKLSNTKQLIIHSGDLGERLVLSCLHTGIGHSHLEALLKVNCNVLTS